MPSTFAFYRSGQQVPADIRILQSNGLKIESSAITGLFAMALYFPLLHPWHPLHTYIIYICRWHMRLDYVIGFFMKRVLFQASQSRLTSATKRPPPTWRCSTHETSLSGAVFAQKATQSDSSFESANSRYYIYYCTYCTYILHILILIVFTLLDQSEGFMCKFVFLRISLYFLRWLAA